MADKITNANLIKTTQIQQKQTDNSMIALRPETQADIVINTSTNILGATVDEAFDNALPVVGAGAVEVNLKNNQLEISVDQSKILPTGGTAGQVITSIGNGKTEWRTPSVATSSSSGGATTITINKTAGVTGSGNTLSTYDTTTIDSKIAAVDQFKYKVSTDAASTPEGIRWHSDSTTITGTLKASASTEFCIYLVPDSSDVESGAYIEYMTVKNGTTYRWEPIGTTRVRIPEYSISNNGDNQNQIQLKKDGTPVEGSLVTINNVSNATTASKLGTVTVGATTIPIYLSNGSPIQCDTYAGGTAVTLNGTNKGARTASFYAPTGAGTQGQILVSSGGVPAWSSWTTVGFLKTNASGVVSVDSTKYAPSANLTAGGTYSVVSYNKDGIITAGGNIIKYYSKTASTGPSTDNDLVQGGFAFIEI